MDDNLQTRNIIDNLKGIAIFFVVLGHGITLYIQNYNVHQSIYVLSDLIYSFNVPLFFLIAGFLCHKQPVKLYVIKKVKRILVPYYFFGLLKLLYSWLISNKFAHGEGINQLLNYILIGDLYWFIYALFIMYIIAIWFWNIKNKKVYYVILMLLIIINSLHSSGWIEFNVEYFQLHKVIQYLPYFLVGYILQYRKESLSKHIKHELLTCFICLLYVCLNCMKLINLGYLGVLIRAISIILVLYIVLCKINLHSKLLLIFAKYSLQIMCLDSFFKIILFSVVNKYITINIYLVVIIALVNMLCGIFVCIVCEKIPTVNRLMGLSVGNKIK